MDIVVGKMTAQAIADLKEAGIVTSAGCVSTISEDGHADTSNYDETAKVYSSREPDELLADVLQRLVWMDSAIGGPKEYSEAVDFCVAAVTGLLRSMPFDRGEREIPTKHDGNDIVPLF